MVSIGALNSTTREKLAHFELNFSRIACIWPSIELDVKAYAVSCMIYGMHLQEARDLLESKYGRNDQVKSIESRIRWQINISLVG